MHEALTHQCQCPACRAGDHPHKELHRFTNEFLSRLDEDHRRWYVALEAMKVGHGGDRLWSLITGLNVETIRRGRRELSQGLERFPPGRIRRPGGGRQALKKKTPRSSPT
jgi:hypothetical protein